jgi:hypothetical protein
MQNSSPLHRDRDTLSVMYYLKPEITGFSVSYRILRKM